MTKIISATPATVNFGTVKPGSGGTSTITIEAIGTERVDVDGITETDADGVFTNDFQPDYVHPEVTLDADTEYFLDANGELTSDPDEAENVLVDVSGTGGDLVVGTPTEAVQGFLIVVGSAFLSIGNDFITTQGT